MGEKRKKGGGYAREIEDKGEERREEEERERERGRSKTRIQRDRWRGSDKMRERRLEEIDIGR